MQVGKYTAVVAICVVGQGLAQTPIPPKTLPRSLGDPTRDKPADPTRVREAAIKALKEDIRSFVPSAIMSRQVEGRWQVWGGEERLKDFGADKAAAVQAARVLQDLRVNQVGVVPGSSPPFEYWLADGKPARTSNGRLLVIPISAPTLRAEHIGGAWVVTDGLKALYDFGADAEAAQRAATVCWKYGFNRLGVVGSPRPAMLYPLFDATAADKTKKLPLPTPSPRAVAHDVARTSLLLPGNVYGGPKTPIDHVQLRVGQHEGEWLLVQIGRPPAANGRNLLVKSDGEWIRIQEGDVLARFGTSGLSAQHALRTLQNAKPTEVARLGSRGIPLFLTEGKAVRGEPLGVTHTPINPDRVKVQKVRETWWLFEGTRPILEIGTKADAEVVMAAVKAFHLRSYSMLGPPEAGGMPFLAAGR